MDELTRKILLDLMIASGHIDEGSVELHELLPKEIANNLEWPELLQIKKALWFANYQAPMVMKRAQESAKVLIGILDKQRQMSIGENV